MRKKGGCGCKGGSKISVLGKIDKTIKKTINSGINVLSKIKNKIGKTMKRRQGGRKKKY